MFKIICSKDFVANELVMKVTSLELLQLCFWSPWIFLGRWNLILIIQVNDIAVFIRHDNIWAMTPAQRCLKSLFFT